MLTAVVRLDALTVLTAEPIVTGEGVEFVTVKVVEAGVVAGVVSLEPPPDVPLTFSFDKLPAPCKVILPVPTVKITSSPLLTEE